MKIGKKKDLKDAEQKIAEIRDKLKNNNLDEYDVRQRPDAYQRKRPAPFTKTHLMTDLSADEEERFGFFVERVLIGVISRFGSGLTNALKVVYADDFEKYEHLNKKDRETIRINFHNDHIVQYYNNLGAVLMIDSQNIDPIESGSAALGLLNAVVRKKGRSKLLEFIGKEPKELVKFLEKNPHYEAHIEDVICAKNTGLIENFKWEKATRSAEKMGELSLLSMKFQTDNELRKQKLAITKLPNFYVPEQTKIDGKPVTEEDLDFEGSGVRLNTALGGIPQLEKTNADKDR